MPTLDTNVLLRWVLDDVPGLAGVVDELVSDGRRFLVPDVAIIELVYVLERVMRLPRATVARSVEALIAVAAFDVDRELWRGAMVSYLAHPKLAITDVFLAMLASSSARTPLLTFDRKLANQVSVAELLGR